MALYRGLVRGAAAGVAGTAAMTAVQYAAAAARGRPLRTPVPRTWAEAPAPAQVAKRLADGLGFGRRITTQEVPLLTNVMHWVYGIAWGVAYGAAATAREQRAPVLAGTGLALTVWTASYLELVPLGIYKPPWDYPLEEEALDLAYHLAYGVGTATAYAALDRR